LATGACMSSIMRFGLYAFVCGRKGGIDVTMVYFRLRRSLTDHIANVTSNAVIGIQIARANGVGIVGERPVGDAAIGFAAISAETSH
jgi:hypothetical protein